MKINSLEIKELISDHASVLSRKLREENRNYIQHFIPFDFSETTIKDILNKKKADKFFGLFLNKELIGFYMLRGFDQGYDIPSYGVWISSNYANKGLSKLTLYHAFSVCKLNNIKTLMLKVHPENTIAKEVYEKFGFIKVGIDEKNGHLIYHKKLTN
ncbi:MAG: GNAT family N-acetyltransferase [Ignavibacteriaceae bacterium]|nr:GNAT family N-acetyltransferase [Ignavibacteriaceae bacterium]